MSDKVTRTITEKEYQSLKDDEAKLRALEAWGVDNWSGYGDALREEGYFDHEGEYA